MDVDDVVDGGDEAHADREDIKVVPAALQVQLGVTEALIRLLCEEIKAHYGDDDKRYDARSYLLFLGLEAGSFEIVERTEVRPEEEGP